MSTIGGLDVHGAWPPIHGKWLMAFGTPEG